MNNAFKNAAILYFQNSHPITRTENDALLFQHRMIVYLTNKINNQSWHRSTFFQIFFSFYFHCFTCSSCVLFNSILTLTVFSLGSTLSSIRPKRLSQFNFYIQTKILCAAGSLRRMLNITCTPFTVITLVGGSGTYRCLTGALPVTV